MKKQLLRPDEVAENLSVSQWTIYRWVTEGKLKTSRNRPGSLRILRHSLEDFIEKNIIDVSPKASEQGLGAVKPKGA